MQIPECQRKNPEDVRICNICGHSLVIKCPGCRRSNPPDSRFCNGYTASS